MDIQVRRANEGDIPRMMDLLLQVCGVHRAGRPDIFREHATKYSPQELRLLLGDESRPIFVGVDETDRVIGYGFCIVTETKGHQLLHDMKTLYIDDLCVDEAYRGRGAGSAIYDAIIAYAREIGCYHLTLNVWACNPSAMAFYESKGLAMLKKEMEVLL